MGRGGAYGWLAVAALAVASGCRSRQPETAPPTSGPLSPLDLAAAEVSAVLSRPRPPLEIAWDPPVEVAAGRAPSPPADLAVTLRPGNEVVVTWRAADGEVAADGYLVRRGDEVLAATPLTGYVDRAVVAYHEYCYVVRAYDRTGRRSAKIGPACVTVPDTSPPTVPRGVVATALGEDEVEVGWEPSSDDVAVHHYEVVRSGPPAPPHQTELTRVTFDGLEAGARACFRVWACDEAENCSPPSGEVCATTPDLTPPTAPAGLTARAVGDRRVDLSWQPATDNVAVAGYEVLHGTTVVGRTSEVSFTVPGVRPGAESCFRVRALDAAANASAPSSTACARTQDLTPPTAPTRVAARRIAPTRVYLAWDPSTDDVGVQGYEVLRDDRIVASVATSQALDGQADGAAPCYVVRAFDAAGHRSAPSARTCATEAPRSGPAPPADVRALRVSRTRVLVQWEPAPQPGAVYRVHAGTKPLATTGHNSYVAIGAHECFRVSVVDADRHETERSPEACARASGDETHADARDAAPAP